MANTKISDFAAAATLDGAEIVPGVQGGNNVKITTQDIVDLVPAPPSGAFADITGVPSDNAALQSALDAKIGDISALPDAAALTGTELVPGLQGAGNVKITTQDIANLVVTGGLISVTVAVSSAEILALNTTPKVLIAAPGAGKFIQVLSGYIFLDFGGTAYSNETTEIEYDTGHNIVSTITTFLSVGVDGLYNITATTGGVVALSLVENSAVRYRATSTNPTLGNGTISINLIYRIVTLF